MVADGTSIVANVRSTAERLVVQVLILKLRLLVARHG